MTTDGEEDVGLQAGAGCGEQPKTAGGRLTAGPEGPGAGKAAQAALKGVGNMWKPTMVRWNFDQI